MSMGFIVEEVSISITMGWSVFAERAFNALAATGLEVKLMSYCLSGNTLRAVEVEKAGSRMHRPASGTPRLRNSLLRRSEAICALCGEPTATAEKVTSESSPGGKGATKTSSTAVQTPCPFAARCLNQYELDGSRDTHGARM